MQREAADQASVPADAAAHTLPQGGDPRYRYRGCFFERQVRWLQRQASTGTETSFGKAAVSVLRRLAIDLVRRA